MLFAEPPKILGKERKNAQKNKENRNTKKARKLKQAQGLEGQGRWRFKLLAIAISSAIFFEEKSIPTAVEWGPVPTPLHAGAPGQRQNVSLLGWVRSDVRLVLSCAVMLMYVLQMIRKYLLRRLSSGTFGFWGFCYLYCFMKGSRGFGAVGKAGELRLLGAFLPKPAPQKHRGVPWAPSPLCFSFWAVSSCNVL